MPVVEAKNWIDYAVSQGPIALIALAFGFVLWWMLKRQAEERVEDKKEVQELNKETKMLLKGTCENATMALNRCTSAMENCDEAIRDSTLMKEQLALAIKTLPCNTEYWRKKVQEL